MKKTLVIVLGICLVAMFAGTVSARDIDRNSNRIMKDLNGTGLLTDDSVPGFYTAAAVDTYQIVRYSFEVTNAMGWTTIDHTAQHDIFYHVDDFVGAGGDYGLLVPISGSQSMWCGARAGNDLYMCGWISAPGYGQNWNQHFESDAITVADSTKLLYHVVTHCEGAGYDELYVDYLDSSDEWITARTFGGYHDSVDAIELTVAETGTSTKFRFHFTADGGWDDQDGLLNTDGALILDDITVSADGVVLDTEDFESANVGDHSTAFWTGFGEAAYGISSGMRTGLMEPDPCHNDYGTQWEFFEGSIHPADQALYPGMMKTPYCLNGNGTEAPCQDEGILSPFIIMTKHSSANNEVQDLTIPAGDQSLFGGVLFRFQVYRDLPLNNLIFYTWGVRNIVNGCPLAWKSRGYVYYGPDQDYLFTGQNVSDLVTSPNDTLQLNFGVLDACDFWGGYYGDCATHTPSPWFDNVYVQRVRTSGPQWAYRSLDIFQDNFPPVADYTGFVRADAANDITETTELVRIDPGDSIVISVTSPTSAGIVGVDAGGYEIMPGGPSVYMHFKVTGALSPTASALYVATVDTGASPSGPFPLPIPVADGTWHKVQGRSARVGSPSTMVMDKFMFDLNDALFVYNHLIEYYFSATDQAAETKYLPTNALSGGSFEWECLPTVPTVYGILFVDDFDGRGSWKGSVHDYMEYALAAVSNKDWDRYDMNAPSSNVANGLASRTDVNNLGMFYEKIIWDSGDLNSGTITNTVDDKTDDCQLLEDWADDLGTIKHEHKTNLLVMGDGVVDNLDWVGAVTFMTNALGVQLVNVSYYALTGGYLGSGVISPLVTPVAGGIFNGLDNFYAFGGCPIINAFDVLDTNDPKASYALRYPDYPSGTPYYAGISLDDTTSVVGAIPKRAVTTGFSIMSMRDANPLGAPVRNEFLEDVFNFFENGTNEEVTDAKDPAAVTKLHGNFPNPFNPTTRIKFDMRVKGHVSIQVYDVAGRLVRTLVNGVRDAGPNEANWSGINNSGSSVASGVYFYKMNTEDYSQTRKMILLR